jgi:hypothetical protein
MPDRFGEFPLRWPVQAPRTKTPFARVQPGGEIMKRIVGVVAAGAVLMLTGAAQAQKAAKAEKGGSARLVLKVTPGDTEVFVDKNRKGTAEKLKEMALPPGKHIVTLKHKGDEHEDQVTLKKGVATTFEWKFEDDRPKAAVPDDDQAGQPMDAPAPETAPK